MKKNLVLITLGIIFFFNPAFNLFDILPDFIGAILIMSGLSKMSFFDGNFKDAKRSAKFLLWISLLRFVFCVFVNSSHRDYALPLTFVVCVLEIMYMLSFFRNLYLGAEYTLMRADCEKYVKYTNEAYAMSFLFTVSVKLLEFAPQITEIAKQEAELDLSHGATFKMPMAQLKIYLLFICMVCALILGILFVVYTLKAFAKLISSKEYCAFLKQKFDDFLQTDRDVYVENRLAAALFLVTFSFVFLFDFYIDAVNVLPSAVGIITVFAVNVTVKRLDNKKINPVVFLACLISSVLCYLFMMRVHFGINYIYSVESFNYSEYPLLQHSRSVLYAGVFSLVECIFTIVLLFACFDNVKGLLKNNNRKNISGMFNVIKIPSVLLCICSFARKISTTLEGHIATNSDVANYVKNKAYILNKQNYEMFMQNESIRLYEKVSTVSYVLAIASVVFALVCILYLFRIRRFCGVDNEYEK